jgi:hypothetical protein
MNTHPFSVFKRNDRPFFLISFKDENGKYLAPVSTKKKTEDEAMQVAFSGCGTAYRKKNLKCG